MGKDQKIEQDTEMQNFDPAGNESEEHPLRKRWKTITSSVVSGKDAAVRKYTDGKPECLLRCVVIPLIIFNILLCIIMLCLLPPSSILHPTSELSTGHPSTTEKGPSTVSQSSVTRSSAETPPGTNLKPVNTIKNNNPINNDNITNNGNTIKNDSTWLPVTTTTPSKDERVNCYMKGPLIFAYGLEWNNISSDDFISEMSRGHVSGIILPQTITQPSGSIMDKEIFRQFTQKTKQHNISVIVDLTVDSVKYNKTEFAQIEVDSTYKNKYLVTYNNLINDGSLHQFEDKIGWYKKVGPDNIQLNLNDEKVMKGICDSLASWIEAGASGVRINKIEDKHLKNMREAIKNITESAILMTSLPVQGGDIDLPIVTEPLFSPDANNVDNINTIINATERCPVFEVAVGDEMNLRGLFSLLVPATPIFHLEQFRKLAKYNLYDEVMKIRHIITDSIEKYDTAVMKFPASKFALSRYNKNNEGYIILYSYLYNNVIVDLSKLNPHPSKVNIIHQTSSCNYNSSGKPEQDAKNLEIQGSCVLVLQYTQP